MRVTCGERKRGWAFDNAAEQAVGKLYTSLGVASSGPTQSVEDVVPIAHSRELVARSGLPNVARVVVGHEHRLADPEPLAAMLAAAERSCGSRAELQ